MKPAPRYVTCHCQHCDGHIEFDANELGEDKNITAPCPHCQLETIVFVPPATSVTATNNSKSITNFTVVIGLLCIAVLFFLNSTIAVCSIPVFAVVVFIVSHFRPLNDEEVFYLANKRRSQKINTYYQFSQFEVSVNLEFKKAMAAEGAYYNIHSALKGFPSLAAALLKYKKHEWIIIGFEKEQKIDFVWLNKGPDNTQVASHLSFAGMVNHARSGNHTTVIVLHNHPNPDPANFYMLLPSEQDKRSAKALEDVLLSASVNLLEFVCERGRFRQFHRAIAPSFIPAQTIKTTIMAENNVSRGRNLQLHLERLF
jgi:hypothetical protein